MEFDRIFQIDMRILRQSKHHSFQDNLIMC